MLINAYPAQTPQKKKKYWVYEKNSSGIAFGFLLLSCPSLYTTFHCIM